MTPSLAPGRLGAMLSVPGEPVMIVILALLLALFPATLRPAGDDDGDGASNLRETVNGCNPLSAASFPTCQWGEVVACSLTEPGFTPPPDPC